MTRERISYFVLGVFFYLLFLVITQNEAGAVSIFKGKYKGKIGLASSGATEFVKVKINRAGVPRLKYTGDTKWIEGGLFNADECGFHFYFEKDRNGQEWVGWYGDVDVELNTLWGFFSVYANPDTSEILDSGFYVFQRVR